MSKFLKRGINVSSFEQEKYEMGPSRQDLEGGVRWTGQSDGTEWRSD
jgi:hypothetical protein